MFESDLSNFERNEIFYAISGPGKIRYLEIGVNFAGTFRRVLDYGKEFEKDLFAIGVDLFEDFINYLDDPDQTHNGINPALPARDGCVVHDGKTLHVAYRDKVIRSLKDAGHENFEMIKGYSDSVIRNLDGPFNVVFIDGNHSYEQTKKDFEAVIDKCPGGSMILFHNATKYEADNLYTDGGPWKVCQEIKNRADLKDHGLVERIWRFQVK